MGAAVLSVVAIGLLCARSQRDAEFYQLHGVRLQRDLGFKHGSPYVRVGGSTREVMTIDEVVPDGPFARAGIQPADIVLDPKSIDSLYRALEGARGATLQITVVPGGDGPPLEERQARTLTLEVPTAG